MATDHVNRLLSRLAKTRGLDRLAMRSLRRATELLGLAIGIRLAEMREQGEPYLRAASRCEEQALVLRLAAETNRILAARWDRVPSKNRPHYTPDQRYRILRTKHLLALTRGETAERFRVDPATISRWEAEAASEPGKETVGSLVKPEPPVRRYADVVRALVQAMALAGFGADERIARTLARAGWRLSKRTVGRIRRERRRKHPSPAARLRQGESGPATRSMSC